jgi:hypothetical protein
MGVGHAHGHFHRLAEKNSQHDTLKGHFGRGLHGKLEVIANLDKLLFGPILKKAAGYGVHCGGRWS